MVELWGVQRNMAYRAYAGYIAFRVLDKIGLM